ncbi:hypothetical protein J6590_012015 [Homalodisca vitripennis]|nr:hypothetical protein J6590_012015 [Homalodisca vitripennis]
MRTRLHARTHALADPKSRLVATPGISQRPTFDPFRTAQTVVRDGRGVAKPNRKACMGDTSLLQAI